MEASTMTGPAAMAATGGAVEPLTLPAEGKTRTRSPWADAGERYELRDPFTESTYRSRSLEDIITKAEALGSSRFVAIAEDGRRTPVTHSGNEWHRGKQIAARADRRLDATPDEPAPTAEHSEPSAQSAQSARSTRSAQPDRSATGPERPALPATSLTTGTAQSRKADAQAERAAHITQLEVELQERYVIKRPPLTLGPVSVGPTEYRFRGDTSRVAFTESALRLATDTNSPSVARSMIDVAVTRGWKGLRVSGSEDFRRLIWLEASVRGVKALGYEPNPADFDVLKREREARQTNRVERMADGTPPAATPSNEGVSLRGGGRKAVVAAIEAILRDRGVPTAKRNAVLEAANEQLAQRARAGRMPKIRVYDPAATSQRASPVPLREPSRSRDRPTPAPAR